MSDDTHFNTLEIVRALKRFGEQIERSFDDTEARVLGAGARRRSEATRVEVDESDSGAHGNTRYALNKISELSVYAAKRFSALQKIAGVKAIAANLPVPSEGNEPNTKAKRPLRKRR